jgi:RimJ/RimL family protein N-acetyltransferase
MQGGAYMTRAGVVKAWRGFGIQQRLIRARETWARRLAQPRIYTYVWAGNVASMRSLNKCGYLPYYWEKCPENGGTYIYLEKKFFERQKAA